MFLQWTSSRGWCGKWNDKFSTIHQFPSYLVARYHFCSTIETLEGEGTEIDMSFTNAKLLQNQGHLD